MRIFTDSDTQPYLEAIHQIFIQSARGLVNPNMSVEAWEAHKVQVKQKLNDDIRYYTAKGDSIKAKAVSSELSSLIAEERETAESLIQLVRIFDDRTKPRFAHTEFWFRDFDIPEKMYPTVVRTPLGQYNVLGSGHKTVPHEAVFTHDLTTVFEITVVGVVKDGIYPPIRQHPGKDAVVCTLEFRNA